MFGVLNTQMVFLSTWEFYFQAEEAEDLDNDMDELLQEFEEKTKRRIIHSVQFY